MACSHFLPLSSPFLPLFDSSSLALFLLSSFSNSCKEAYKHFLLHSTEMMKLTNATRIYVPTELFMSIFSQQFPLKYLKLADIPLHKFTINPTSPKPLPFSWDRFPPLNIRVEGLSALQAVLKAVANRISISIRGHTATCITTGLLFLLSLFTPHPLFSLSHDHK